MGCDIHMYVEYSPKKENVKVKDRHWYPFGGRINPGRNYWLFGYLSGVRSDSEGVFPLKGLPNDMSYYAKNDAFLYIDEEIDKTNWSDGMVSLEDARRWEKSGSKIQYRENGKPWYVSHPDWHSHSWLTFHEFRFVINKMKIEKGHDTIDIEYLALLGAMQTLANGLQGAGSAENDVRVIFWFDS